MKIKNNSQDRWHLCTLILILLAAPTPSLYAASGDLDNTFGNGGKVVTDFAGTNDEAHVIAIQPDGKIILAGRAETMPSSLFTSIALVRYMPNGNLDSSFGNSGKVTTDFGGFGFVVDMALQHDGKILVVGNTSPISRSQSPQSFIFRYNTDGSLDGDFGSVGRVTVNELVRGDALALQSDNKIVIAGSGSVANDFSVARYNPDGSLDTSFGRNGSTTTHLGPSDTLTDIILQPDGKIVAVGSSRTARLGFSGTSILALARYNPDGGLDTNFGSAGKIIASELGSPTEALAVILQGDGKIVVAGIPNLVRYNSNGTLDTSFGSGGRVITPGVTASAVVLQSNGKIVTGGTTTGGQGDFSVVRYNADGSLDISFGSSGISLTDFSSRSDILSRSDHVFDLALQPDGHILAAGVTFFPTLTEPRTGNSDFALARYQGDDPSAIPDTVSFSAASYQVSESAGTAVITVTRAGGGGTASVNYATSNGTAIAPSDFTGMSGALNFAAGETSKTFSVPITNDTAIEPNETINLALSNPIGGVSLAAPSTAVLTITDDDSSGGGGGGCTLNTRGKPDVTLPLLLVLAMIYLLRRRFIRID